MAVAPCPNCGGSVPERARFCPHCAARAAADLPAEERKIATILFADLVGSTELGASQDPERTRAMLGRFYRAMSTEIEAAGGTVEKFVGDAVMAAFGTPTAHEDDAERALRAGVAMRHKLQELFGDQLVLRIGVNTGEVVVGHGREGDSFVTGDAVNIAARLEQTAGPGEIVVGERTVSAAIDAFEFTDSETIDVKGRRDVVCRRLIRELDGRHARVFGSLRPAFVGRERELDSLLDEYRQTVVYGRPRLLTLIGDAGVGKTALARCLWERVDGESPRPLRMVGRCPSYGRGITYAPLGDILRSALRLLESDAPAVVLDRLGPRPILGLTLGLDVAGDLHPLAARERLQEAWVDFLAALARHQPLLIVLEDLHWGEDPLLDLVERVVSDLQAPLMVVATARPDLPDGWRARLAESGPVLDVDLLSRRDSERLLRELLAADLPTSVREAVLTRAEGNPFFLEELLGALIDGGVLRPEGDRWTTTSLPEAFVIPDSVHATLASRVDLLDRPEKEALQAAAVVGRVFWTSAVYELLPEATPDFRVLESRGFIRRRPHSALEGEREYAIKHALTREVAYGSVPKARRAHLHAGFAEWLERRGAGRDEHAPLLAHHYAEAVSPDGYTLAWSGDLQEGERLRDKAATWLHRAAELGIGRYEIDDALALLERALMLTRNEAEQAEVWRTIGRARALKHDGEGFWTAMLRAIDVTDDATDPHAVAETYATLALQTALRPAMWKRNPDRELVDGWIERAVELAPVDTRARAEALVARAFWHRLDSHAADDAREGATIAERLRAVDVLSYAFSARALVALASSDYAEAEEATRRRLALLPKVSDPDHQADVYWSSMVVYSAVGRLDEARRLARLNDEINSLLTPHHRVHGIAARVRVDELCGHWDIIRELQCDAESRVAANFDTPCSDNVFCLLVCALARAELGDWSEAARLERAADELGFEGYVGDLAGPRIRLALRRAEFGRVEDLLFALQEQERRGSPSLTTRAARIDGLVTLGRAPEVEEEAQTLLLSPYLEPFALRALAVANDDQVLLERAVEKFTALGLRWHAAQTPLLSSVRR
jgi:class 3 adenylate cyclase/tetratricopeptide (TPR) repeat protein